MDILNCFCGELTNIAEMYYSTVCSEVFRNLDFLLSKL